MHSAKIVNEHKFNPKADKPEMRRLGVKRRLSTSTITENFFSDALSSGEIERRKRRESSESRA
jgi:hypothetical protein